MTDVILDEFVVFSDHHAHTYPYGSKQVEYSNRGKTFFTNSRLKAAADVIYQIEKYVSSKKIKKVFFLGDMFHVREAVPTAAVNIMFDAINYLSYCTRVHMMPGNHDYSDRDGNVHSLHTFSSIASIHDWSATPLTEEHGNPRQFDIEENYTSKGDPVRYSFIPYTDDRAKAAEAIKKAALLTKEHVPHILFGHFGIQGAKVGSDYVLVSDNDLSVDDIPWKNFTGCLFGHYHQHQKVFDNGWYVGATHHHNWGDANTKRGFLHVKVYIDRIDFDFIESDAPRFIMTKDPEVEVRSQDFLRIITDKKQSLAEIEKLQNDSGSENCEVIYIPPELEETTMELSEENLSPSNMLASWVEANKAWLKENAADLDPEALVAYGEALLSEIK